MEATTPTGDELVDWIGDGPAGHVVRMDHSVMAWHAEHAAGQLEAHGVAAEFICPGDGTRYVASIINTSHLDIDIGVRDWRDGPRERYIISFGTDEHVGRRELNFTWPPYLPDDCRKISNGHQVTDVVCWVFLNYLHRAMNPGNPQPLPWLR